MFELIRKLDTVNSFKVNNQNKLAVYSVNNESNWVSLFKFNQLEFKFRSNLKYVTDLQLIGETMYVSSSIDSKVEKIDFSGQLQSELNVQLILALDVGYFCRVKVKNKKVLSFNSEEPSNSWTLSYFTSQLLVVKDTLYCISYEQEPAIEIIDLRSGHILSKTSLTFESNEIVTEHDCFLSLNESSVFFKDINNKIFLFDLN